MLKGTTLEEVTPEYVHELLGAESDRVSEEIVLLLFPVWNGLPVSD